MIKKDAFGNDRGVLSMREASITFLIAFIIIEAYSLLKTPLNSYLASSMGIAAIVLGLLGTYGLFKRNKTGGYSALLSVILGVASNFQCTIRLPSQTIFENYLMLASSVSLLILGALVMISIFKMRLNYEVEQQSEESNAKDPSSEVYAIETENVTKKYIVGSNVISAVNGISLKVKKGEFVSIMGPSGSGKSTLLNLIGALDRPTSGRVLIDGVDISKLDDKELASLRNRKIGFVFQSYNLIARSTVKRNMELPALVSGLSKRERLKRIRELLDVVGLSGKMDRKPKTLSGGEQQRVAIARALMNNPEIVLADEPTGNVDSRTGRIIMNFFRKLNRERGTTMLIVTHDPEVARMTDRIIYIRDGRIFKEERRRGE